MRRTVLYCFIGIFLLFLSACGKKDPLLGTWQEPVSGIQMEFNDDGTLVISRGGASFTVDYEEKNPNIIALTPSEGESFPIQSFTYQITSEGLIVTVDNVPTVFSRMK